MQKPKPKNQGGNPPPDLVGKMAEKTIQDIEKEMKEIHPEKELAYMDYCDNTGDNTGLREHLWDKYDDLRNRWNVLVVIRKKLLDEG